MKIIRSNDELNALANGKNLVTNGDFSQGTAGFISNGAHTKLSVVNGRLRIEEVGGVDWASTYTKIPTTNGVEYEVAYEKYEISATGRVSINGVINPDTFIATGQETLMYFTADTTTAGNYSEWDNISVKEIPQVQGENLPDYVATRSNFGMKNLIINGGFDVWQRGNGPFTGYNYGADRWVSVSGSQYSSATGGSVGKRIMRITNSTAGATLIAQAIELNLEGYNAPFNVGKTFTVSITYSSTTKIKPIINFRDSAVGANPIDIFTDAEYKGGNNVSETVSWTFTVNSDCLPTNNCLVLFILGESNASNVYMYNVQLEEGSVATPFEQRPIGLELSLCQRYYEKSYNTNTNIGTATLSGASQASAVTGWLLSVPTVKYKVKKRIPPTVVIYNPYVPNQTGNAIEYNAASIAVSDRPVVHTPALTVSSETQLSIQSANGTFTANNLILWHWTALAEL